MYTLEGEVAVIGMDDGKANAVGHALIDEVNEGLTQSLAEAKAVVIVGRPGLFSAGFDLKEFENGPEATRALIAKGARMMLRLFSHPQPVVAACTGHAIAAGAFMLLASDTRIGAQGEFKIGLNETAIGMTLPVFALELSKARLSKRHQSAAVIQAQLFSPDAATDVGFLDEVVAAEQVLARAIEVANVFAAYPGSAYGANKLALRAAAIATIEASLTG